MEYRILQVSDETLLGRDLEKTAGKLEKMVNEAMKDGWKPQGGVSAGVKQNIGPYLLQAMIKD